MQALTQPIKWHGGKGAFNGKLAKWIISLMPPHLHYVEPYFGGGSVLLHKDPEGVSEVVNDIHAELIQFWMVLSNPDRFEALIRRVEATPFSEDSFRWSKGGGERDVEKAWAFFIRARQSRQGLMKDFATLSRTRTRGGMNEQVSAWLTAVEGLADVHTRMKRVVILNRPALDVIKQQDGPETLFYCDPPYLHGTRSTTGDYKHEMSIADHTELLLALKSIQGKFLLSGYHSDLYHDAAELCGWRCHEFEIVNNASSKGTKETKTECIWTNAVN